jgi:hypothetical protein
VRSLRATWLSICEGIGNISLRRQRPVTPSLTRLLIGHSAARIVRILLH